MIIESKSGVVCGIVGGVYKLLDRVSVFIDIVSWKVVLQNILIVAITALVSGFLGAVGAHIFKIITKKIKR